MGARRSNASVDVGTLPSEHVYRAFVDDFEGAWTALMGSDARGRGNLLFAQLAMQFLEWCARVTEPDPQARDRFVRALDSADPMYFAQLPSSWSTPPTRLFAFPTKSGLPEREYLWALFDMVRNGVAHKYLQPDAELRDARLRVQITGATRIMYRAGWTRPPDYLVPVKARGNLGPLDPGEHDVVVAKLYPDVLFADVLTAADAANADTLPPARWRLPSLDVSAADLIAGLLKREG